MNNPLIILLGGDILIAYAAYTLGYLALRGNFTQLFDLLLNSQFGGLLFMSAVVLASFFTGMYRLGEKPRKRHLIVACVCNATIAFVSLSTILYQLETKSIENNHLIIGLIVFALLQFYWHARCNYFFSLSWFQKRVLIIGCGKLAKQVTDSLHLDRGNPQLIGYLRIGDDECILNGDKLLGTGEDLRNVALNEHVDTIIIAVSQRRGTIPVRDILTLKLRGVQILDSNSFIEEVSGQVMVENINPSWFIFAEGIRMNTPVKILRRTMDILLASLGLLIAAPFLPLVALAIKFDSPGKVFFKQTRVGEGEQIFSIYKLRTMNDNAESESGAVWSGKNDPRITRLGSFLRKTRIDEIPQLINVLQGDMSFVGPRPERPEFVEFLKKQVPYYSYRHVVKPGVTGWAQVRFPYGASVDDALAKLRYDLYYIKNYSPFLDIIIIVETIQVVLFGKGGR